MILLIDNYDSFVHNLGRYFQRLGHSTCVVRNDAIRPSEVQSLMPDLIVLSPGPRTPDEAGCSLQIVRECAGRIPILGVCLGHQTIAAACGAKVIRADQPRHGRTSWIHHDGQGEFAGLANPMRACRYHSLVVDENTLPNELVVSARTTEGVVMAIRHLEFEVAGWQFHPEAILTDVGYPLLGNLLKSVGLAGPDIPSIDDERHVNSKTQYAWPDRPVTF